MKLASRVIIVAVAISVFCLTAFSQVTLDPSRKSDKDPRNEAPTVGTGGPTGGPTGLFTVYDGKTLRKGEHTFSIAYSNYDRDPGNMDFTEVPISFQVGLGNRFEVFYQTDVYRGVKVNSLRNISGTYLPNSGFNFPGTILAPNGTLANPLNGLPVFRLIGSFTNVAFPFFGGNVGNLGLQIGQPGQFFGFCAVGVQCAAVIGTPIAGGANGSFFPGLGSANGGILPGIVLQTTTLNGEIVPNVFTVAPSYNPDAPLINKRYGESWLNTHTGGFKWRWTGNDNPVGVGIMAAYRWFHDRAPNRIDELFDGASPGGNRGDILGTFFVDARVGEHVNISANVGYHLNSDIKS